jgi:hypothetical protein
MLLAAPSRPGQYRVLPRGVHRLHLIVPLADPLKDFLLSCDGPGSGELAAWHMQTLNGLKLARGQTRSEAAMHPMPRRNAWCAQRIETPLSQI